MLNTGRSDLSIFCAKKTTDMPWSTPPVVVLRVGDAWLVGVGKRAPHGFVKVISGVLVRLTTCKRLTNSLPKLSLITGSGALVWSLLMARWIDSKLIHYFLYIEL